MRVTPLERPTSKLCFPVAAVTLLLAVPGSAGQAQEASLAAVPPELEAVRTALDKYRDPIVAVHDGYLSTVGCIEYPSGGRGVHFFNLQLIGPTLDPAEPQVLIYEPDGDELRLVAAEWFVPVEVAGPDRPAIFGRELEGPMEGHKPLMPEGFHHYDLHVWLWKANPAGVFSPTNPELACPENGYSFAESAPKLVPHEQH